jgi:hypothetical protein
MEKGAIEESLGVKSVSARRGMNKLTVLTNEKRMVEVQKAKQMKNWADPQMQETR